MLPITNITNPVVVDKTSLPTKTFGWDINTNKIFGMVDEIEALKLTIYLILNCERYKWLIYSYQYGVQFNNLIGKDMFYVSAQIQPRINDALIRDGRINSTSDYSYEIDGGKLHVTFTANTIYGPIPEQVEFRM